MKLTAKGTGKLTQGSVDHLISQMAAATPAMNKET